MKVIAFYTEDTAYEKEVENLRSSLVSLGIDHEIKPYKTKGKWELNCGMKPAFILEMMDKYPGEVLVYLDADAVVRRPLVMAENFTSDIAVHYKNRRELLSGTVILRSNSKVRELVKRWADVQECNPSMWDQKTLSMVMVEPTWGHLDIVNLPVSYIQIFDDNRKPNDNPVVEHFQASRRFKARIALTEDLPRGVRVDSNGNLWLPKNTKKIVAWLDAKYPRLTPNELRWRPGAGDNVPSDELNGIYSGMEGYIVGKGPSLDLLSSKDFNNPKAPIFCLNEAITVVQEMFLPNPIYAVIDPPLEDRINIGPGITVLANMDTSWYAGHRKRISYSTREIALTRTPLTGEISIKLLQKAGIAKVIMLCFDACMGGSLQYAKSVGYDASRGGVLARFKTHHARFTSKLGETDHEFRQVVRKANDDTPQRL